jgi:hypothetical protein
MNRVVWECKIGGPAVDLPSGADGPMRDAVGAAFQQLTGSRAEFIFSGWGASLTEGELAVVENRAPVYEPRPTLDEALRAVLNRYSVENGSNTPDFILATYMLASLKAFETASLERERWYGKSLRIGMGADKCATCGNDPVLRQPALHPSEEATAK